MPRLLIHFKFRPIQVAALLFFPFALIAQVPEEFETLAEDRSELEEETDLPTEMLEEQTDRLNVPLNLNLATAGLLRESGLFTPYQIHHLLKYRETYGDLYSIYELVALPGFSRSHLNEISGYITVDPALSGDGPSPSRSGHVPLPGPPPRNLFLINLERIFPKPAGYSAAGDAGDKPAYLSTPLRFNFRIRARLTGRLSCGLAFDKDPGEPFFQGLRPEFVSGYMQYRGTGTLRRLVLGSYRLQHGLGLVNGTGFMHTPSGFRIHRLSMSALKPYASLNENRFHRGIAAGFNIRQTNFLLWSSYKNADLSLFHLPEHPASVDWLSLQRNGGLHRTRVETGGRSLAFHHHSGIQFLQQYRNLTLGAMAGIETAGLSAKGKDSLLIGTTPVWHSTLSMHWRWFHPKAETFGEMAVRDLASVALLSGVRVHFSDFLKGLLLLHHYGSSFSGVLASSYASGSHIRNEDGISLHLQAEPGRYFKAGFTCALFVYPSPRYLTGVPSMGFKSSCILQHAGEGMIRWKLQLDRKVWQRTLSAEAAGIRPLTTARKNKISLQLRYTPIPSMQWQSRILLSLLSKGEIPSSGYAAYQQFRIQIIPALNFTLRFLVFHVTEWDNRIYIHEPGLYYSFRFPVFYGQGQKVNWVVSLKTGKSNTLAGSFSVLSYSDRDRIGSGNDLIEGSRKWEAEIQFRRNF